MELYNKGTRYLNKNNPLKAIQFFRKSLRVEGEFKETYLNLGNSYRLMRQYDNAISAYALAASVNTPFIGGKFGPYPLALNNLGLMAFTLGDDSAAIEKYSECLALDPLHYDAIWNYSISLLRGLCSRETVDAAGAWKMYSYRFKRSTPTNLDRSIPLWDGVSRVGSLCVLAEQGFGDKIMFGQYIEMLRPYADEIYVQCPEELDFIFSGYKTCRVATGDYGVPICSLASRFDPNLVYCRPWLSHLYTPRKNLALLNRPRIGIVWSGSSSHPNDANRSMPVAHTRSLGTYGELVSLNPGATVPSWITSTNIKSYEDTVRELNNIDLLITCDTSIVHLAGSMGVPTLMFQPLYETDFRWGKEYMGEHNVWYESVKIIRGCSSWDAVEKALRAKLENFKIAYANATIDNVVKAMK